MNTEILNKYIELINKGYCEDCNELNCIGNFPHKEIAKNIKVILEENQELKKQLENTDYTSVYLKGCTDTKGKYLSQQKEFIEYLEDKLCVINNLLNTEQDEAKVYYLIVRRTAFDEILSKYKEIIGGKNE